MAILMQEIWNFCLQRSDIHYNLILCFDYREQMIRPARSYDSTSSFHVPLSRVQASLHSKQLASVHDCQNWTCTAVELLVALHSCKKNIPISCGINLTNIISCPRILLTDNYNTKIRNKRYEIWVLELFFSSSIYVSKYLEKQV